MTNTRSTARRWIYIGVGILVAVAIIILGVAGYAASANTKMERSPIGDSPANYGLDYESVSFPSRGDNLSLQGWYIHGAENEEDCILMIHGHGGNRDGSDALEIAQALAEHGYNVLMFDLRGCGESEGERVTLGYYERDDVLGAIDYLASKGIEEENIGLLGFSLGAATAIVVAAEEPEIPVVVADSSYTSMIEMIKQEIPNYKLPRWFVYPVVFMFKLMYGIDLSAVEPIKAIGDISPRPILIIHGQADSYIPVSHAERLFEASHNPNAELWLVSDADHTKAYQTHTDEYLFRIISFFDQALK